VGEQHLALLKEMVDLLARYAVSVRREDLERDRETWLKVRGALEVASQCAIDLALRIVARRGLGVPQTYREAFSVLARTGIIDGVLAKDLEAWAGLRNVLVHIYTDLDLDRVVAALSQSAPLVAFHAIASREFALAP
jgi:uncharacterized protein YutE (UPF0331/DUF86 family)